MQIRAQLDKLELSNEAVWEAEERRVAQPSWGAKNAPLPIRGAYLALCLVLDVIYDRRPIQRFWFLEAPPWAPCLAGALLGWALSTHLLACCTCRPLSAAPARAVRQFCALCGRLASWCRTWKADTRGLIERLGCCAGGGSHAVLCLHLNAAPVRVPGLVARRRRAAQGTPLHHQRLFMQPAVVQVTACSLGNPAARQGPLSGEAEQAAPPEAAWHPCSCSPGAACIPTRATGSLPGGVQVHFAEEWNELHHLMIMEALGGDQLWVDRFMAQHAAVFYYWVLIGFFAFSPSLAYMFSEMVEVCVPPAAGCGLCRLAAAQDTRSSALWRFTPFTCLHGRQPGCHAPPQHRQHGFRHQHLHLCLSLP